MPSRGRLDQIPENGTQKILLPLPLESCTNVYNEWRVDVAFVGSTNNRQILRLPVVLEQK